MFKTKHINPRKSTIPGKKECQNFCGLVWRPLCGSNGETYASNCIFKFENCLALNRGEETVKIAHDGKCNQQVIAIVL